MKWLELHLDTTHEGLETAEAFLSSLGIDGVVIDDEIEFQEFVEEHGRYWGCVDEALLRREQGMSRITFYLEENEAGFQRLAAIRMALSGFKREHPECGSLLLTMENLEDADWENNWKQYYKPIKIGKQLIIIPEWETAAVGGRTPLILNPGLTFGTGSHASTRLCLLALEREICGGERVLDLGCGSGILSIAALKLGAKSAVAVDIEADCRTVALENAELNGITPAQYTIHIGDLTTDSALAAEIGSGYDVVLANIVADVIMALAPRVHGLLNPGGLFLCSGIIDTRSEEVQNALRAAGLTILEVAEADGWVACTCS